MKKAISDFIKGNKIASIACVNEHNAPYCFNCFYVFDEEYRLLFFKSSAKTRHSELLSANRSVAGSILPDKIDFLAMKGIQFTGVVLSDNFPDAIVPERYYHRKLPMALAKAGQVWCIQLDMVKMTDSTNVFGEKLIWRRAAAKV